MTDRVKQLQKEIYEALAENRKEFERMSRLLNGTLMKDPPEDIKKGLGYVGPYGDGLSYPKDY